MTQPICRNPWMKLIQSSLFFSFFIFVPVVAMAAEPTHVQIPVKRVLFELLNFSIFVGILFFLLRKKVIQMFMERYQTYNQAHERAQQAREHAERHHAEIRERLEALTATADQNLEKARSEAAELRAEMLLEAKNLSERLQVEAQRTAEIELERAKVELREELLTKSLDLARKLVQEKLVESDQTRLQSEFVEKIQVVSS